MLHRHLVCHLVSRQSCPARWNLTILPLKATCIEKGSRQLRHSVLHSRIHSFKLMALFLLLPSPHSQSSLRTPHTPELGLPVILRPIPSTSGGSQAPWEAVLAGSWAPRRKWGKPGWPNSTNAQALGQGQPQRLPWNRSSARTKPAPHPLHVRTSHRHTRTYTEAGRCWGQGGVANTTQWPGHSYSHCMFIYTCVYIYNYIHTKVANYLLRKGSQLKHAVFTLYWKCNGEDKC